jgi:class 3 adenylate cyclase/WD40 repeat protein
MDDAESATGATTARVQTATLLFCDMVGSTELLNRLGMSASEELRRRFNGVLREAVRATGGEEVKTLGDGLMVVFLQSARDAVECAVAMQRGIDRLNLENPLLSVALRVGIALGEATYSLDEDDWHGPAVNTAARLCAKARSEQILATSVLVEVVGEAPELFRDVGAFELKGIPRAVPTVEVLWSRDPPEAQAVPLDATLDVGAGTPFVGHRDALAQLVELQRTAERGQPTAICITGEPGVGKTRLARELALGAHRAGAVVLYARASAEHQHPIQPLADALRWYAASLPTEELASELGDLAPDLAELLPGLRYRLSGLARRLVPSADRSADAAIQLLRGACRRGTVMLLLDDAHQAAPQLPRVVAPLVEQGDLRLMVIGLLREDGPTWAGFAKSLGATSMRLDGLSVDEVAELVRAVVRTEVDDALVASIHASTAGNPGHVLEVAHNIAESGTVDATVVRDVIEHTCPYRGLVAYTPADHALFFGRDELVSAMLGRLARSRFLAVVGPSGSGKSSAVLAGMVPALERGALPGSDGWPVVVLEPGSEPIGALAAALASRAGAGESSVALERALASDPQALHDVAVRLVDDQNRRLILVVDQFEEVFTSADEAPRDCLLTSLLHAASAPGGPVSAVIVLRADFYGPLASVPGLAPVVEGNQVLVGPMSTSELTEAITQPAFVAGLRLEEGLADTIVRDAAGQAGALPLVSHALLETWHRREGRTLTVAAYRDAGGVHAAVARSAEAAYEALSEDDQPRVRSLFLRLVTLGEGSEDTRRRVAIAELPQPLARLVPPLVAARLLTTDEETVEVAHEALIREWPRLRAWLDEDRAALRMHRHLTQTATAWDEAGREPAELFAGARLATAIEWQKAAQPELNDVERQFLAAGQRRQRSRTRRRRGLIAGMAILTVGAVLAAVLAVSQQRRADRSAREAVAQQQLAERNEREAQAQQQLAETNEREAVTQQERAESTAHELGVRGLMDRSALRRDSERDVAALLAIEAYKIEPRLDTLGALLSTFATTPGFDGTIPLAKPSIVGEPLPDGHTYAALEQDNTVHLIDLDSRREVGQLPAAPELDVWEIQVTPDGQTLVGMADTEDRQTLLVEWDLTTKTLRSSDVRLLTFPGAMAISPDSRFVAIGGGTPGLVEVRSLADGSLVRTILNLKAPSGAQYRSNTSAVTFLPDGTLAVGSQQGAIRIVDPATGAELRRLEGPREMSEGELVMAPDGASLYGGGARGTMAWDLTSGQTMWSEPAPPCGPMKVATRLGALLCSRDDGSEAAYDLATGLPGPARFDYQQGLPDTDITRDGALLIQSGGPSLALWRLDGGGPVSHPLLDSTAYTSVEFDGLGHLLANRRTEYTSLGAAVVDPTTGAVVDDLDGVLDAFTTPRVGRLFAWFDDGTGGFYDLAERRRVPGFSVPLPFEYRWAIGSGNLLLLGIGTDGLVQGVDLTTGQLTAPSLDTDEPIQGAIASPDGHRVFTGDSVGVRHLDGTATGEGSLLRGAAHLAFGKDLMVADSEDGNLRVFDSRTLERAGPELPAINGQAHDLVMSSDASRLMVVGNDRTLRLADMAERSFIGAPIDMGEGAAYRGEATGVTAPALSPDGQVMAYANKQGIIVWDLDPDHLIAGACKVASRNLTRAEWEENISDLAPYTELCPGQPSA